MIYNLNGKKRLPIERSGEYAKDAYTTIGNRAMFIPLLEDEFDTFDTTIWECLKSHEYGSGVHSHYIPENYSNNAYVEDGKLIVRNLKDNPTGEHEWSGAFINTKNKFEFQNGIVISKLRFPDDAKDDDGNSHYHSTFWMLACDNESFPKLGGEIDIAESESGSVTIALHWYNKDGVLQTTEGTNVAKLFNYSWKLENYIPTDYHTYVMYWDENNIVFHCDGVPIGTFNIDDATVDGVNSFKQKFYLIYNTNPKIDVDSESYTSVTNTIEYVRVYDILTHG